MTTGYPERGLVKSTVIRCVGLSFSVFRALLYLVETIPCLLAFGKYPVTL